MNKKIPLISVKVVREKTLPYLSEREITSPSSAYALLRDLIEDKDRECFVVLALNNRNQPNYVEIVSQGTVNKSVVSPRDIFKSVLLSNSCKIFIAHNHPSGLTTPSESDINITKLIEMGGEFLDVQLLDHLIIGDDKYFSFREKGMLEGTGLSNEIEEEALEYEK